MTLASVLDVLGVIFLIGFFFTCLCILLFFFGNSIYLAVRYIGKMFDVFDNKLERLFRDKFYQ